MTPNSMGSPLTTRTRFQFASDYRTVLNISLSLAVPPCRLDLTVSNLFCRHRQTPCGYLHGGVSPYLPLHGSLPVRSCSNPGYALQIQHQDESWGDAYADMWNHFVQDCFFIRRVCGDFYLGFHQLKTISQKISKIRGGAHQTRIDVMCRIVRPPADRHSVVQRCTDRAID